MTAVASPEEEEEGRGGGGGGGGRQQQKIPKWIDCNIKHTFLKNQRKRGLISARGT